ncbi:smad nuclear-interacting protein 1 [Phyllosticta citriasiana]|uniref:Smad nuclear-interacting protein 1 n=1 Tax=Phyllosticta citriasiana TaxID=595635 RepID=A0ABR1KY97_9PEZI
MATDSASTSPRPRPPPRRESRRSPSEERVHSRGGGQDLEEDDHRRERRRQRHSRSPDERRSKHSRRHRDESRDGERSHRRRNDNTNNASRRKRSLSRSRDERNRSRSASRERHDKRRPHRDHSGSPTRPHRRDRKSERSVSPRSSRRSGRGGRSRSRSRSPRRRKPSASPSPPPRSKRSSKPLPSQEAAYNGSDSGPVDKPVEKQKPNFKQTGLLARETNTVAGTNVVLKYNEPSDARKPPPRDDWRLFIFKGKDLLHTLELGSRSCWLIGREPAVADLLVEHPSTSKQHAVLQFRYTTRTNEFGDKSSKVRPYLIDLESSNGTFLNGKKVEATRFVEVMAQDMIKFGQSEREYVLMLAPA